MLGFDQQTPPPSPKRSIWWHPTKDKLLSIALSFAKSKSLHCSILPHDVFVLHVLVYFSVSELATTLMIVCKHWLNESLHTDLWRILFSRHHIGDRLTDFYCWRGQPSPFRVQSHWSCVSKQGGGGRHFYLLFKRGHEQIQHCLEDPLAGVKPNENGPFLGALWVSRCPLSWRDLHPMENTDPAKVRECRACNRQIKRYTAEQVVSLHQTEQFPEDVVVAVGNDVGELQLSKPFFLPRPARRGDAGCIPCVCCHCCAGQDGGGYH
eukprot:TRINITY_DN52586_c0_g1_i2.p1 TRINITY_DN52586_c0_g1~~TRINITY_DN52586_c0_g1_i2.p1  ORF type:complete len:265 (-),score=0.10 TRINITY_DN52586_c0_g1_i2:79-873(-)